MVTLDPVHPNTVGGVHPYLMAISFPFRVDPHSGGVVTVPESSTQHINETIAVTVMVHPGEKHLNPNFGTPTLPFSDALEAGALQLNLTDNGWGHVRVANVTTTYLGDNTAESDITWEVGN